jgi:hypothetical protein
MSEDGTTKDDVKVPEGEVGEKITKLFREEEKDTSEYTSISAISMANTSRRHCLDCHGRRSCHGCQGSSSWLNGVIFCALEAASSISHLCLFKHIVKLGVL